MKSVAFLIAVSLAVAAHAEGAKKGLINLDDYPPQALREGREGNTKVDLTIGFSGRVTDCVILESSGHADLDAASCKIMRERAVFNPVTDESGKAIEAHFTTFVTWAIR